MKIRTGFVSNSSSSSFVVYGTYIYDKEDIDFFHNKLKEEIGEEKFEEWYEEKNCLCDYIEEDLTMFNYDGTYYIGRDPFSIKDDETGKQFRDSTKKVIQKYTNRTDCRDIVEEFYC